MTDAVESLITCYERGRITRRDLVASLAALAAVPAVVSAQQDTTLMPATLNHVSLIVSDVERSVAFYQRVFGLPVTSRQTGGVNLAVGDGFVGVYQGGRGAQPHINHFCFGLRDFDPQRTVMALNAQGIEAEARVRDGVPQVYCADPDNLRIQLQDASFCGGLGALGDRCE